MYDKNNIKERTYYVDQISASLGTPVIKVITGMRRVGKSSIMQSVLARAVESGDIMRDHIFSLNKELPEYFHIQTGADLWWLLEPWLLEQDSQRCIIAIDEVQEISGWEKIVSGILAQYGDQCDIILTGSNSHLLSGDLATLIAGRYIMFQIFPLSWHEYLEFSGDIASREIFLEYMEYGGMPGIHEFPRVGALRMSYLRSVYESIVLRDIVERFQIRNLDFLRNLYHYVCGSIGHIVSAQSIAKYLRNQKLTTSVDSIILYLGYGVHTYIFEKVGSVEPNTKKIFEIYHKYYITDMGLRNSIVGYRPSRDRGEILENIVCMTLLKYGYSLKIGRIGDREVDFIGEKWSKKLYIQVALTLVESITRDREYASLRLIQDAFPRYVVHFDSDIWGITEDGIQHISILDLENLLISREA